MHYRLALVLAMLSPAIVTAQRRDTAAVPRDLVLALVANSFSEPNELTIGTPPPGFPRDLIPQTSTVLGGLVMSGPRSMPGQLMVVTRMNSSRDSALVLVEQQLTRSGWTLPPARGMERGGFVATATYGPGMGGHFCRGDSLVTSRAMSRAEGGAYVTVVVSGARRSACDPQVMRRVPGFDDWIQLPELRIPTGARASGSSRGRGSDHSESSVQLQTTLSPASLLDHFAEQLQRAGWTLGARLTHMDAALLTASKSDSSGRRNFGSLSVVRLGESERVATVRVAVPASRD